MKSKLKHIGLFAITLLTTTLAGLEWTAGKTFLFNGKEFSFGEHINSDDWHNALIFSCSFLFILTVHEFGHYFTGVYYKTKVTLPYYIPMWFLGLGMSIGTMGAFIKIKSQIRTTKEFFDIGVAGPLAGFVAALLVIWYGFENLPPLEYIFNIHPEYKQYGLDYANYVYKDVEGQFSLGNNLLFTFFKWAYSDSAHLIPNNFEMLHYPFLFAGYLACFFTALNLIPIGQLDGGHVLYGLIGHKKANKVFPYFYIVLILYAGLGLITPNMIQDDLLMYVPMYLLFLNFCFQRMYPELKERVIWILGIFLVQVTSSYLFPEFEGYNGWLVFGLLIGRFLGVKHPPALIEENIGLKRKVIGIFSILVFIVCFSPYPFIG